jgi:molybdopterin molybdotransferase
VKVGFFSTGDELQSIDQPLAPGKIYDSNRYCIGAMLREKGFDIIDYGVIKDNPETLKECLLRASQECDAVITSGGVSVGEADFTRKVVLEIGELISWHCLIKPGKPLAVGKIGKAYFFGLPGNPTAAQVTFYAIVSIALALLSGQKDPKLVYALAAAKGKFKKNVGYTDFQRGLLTMEDCRVTVTPAGSQKTGALKSMIKANCFIYLADNQAAPADGELIPVVPFWGAC